MSAVEFSPDSTPALGSFSLRDFMLHIFYNAKLVRNCVIIGLALGIAAAAFSRTQYTATSLVMVLSAPGALPTELGGAASLLGAANPRGVESDGEIVKSEPVIRSAVEQVGVYAFVPGGAAAKLLSSGREPSERQVSKAIDKFRRDLKVDTEPGSNLIHISFGNPDRERAVQALQALLDAYSSRRRVIYEDSAAKLQQQEVQRYGGLLTDLDSKIKNAQGQAGVLNIAQDVQLAAARQDSLALRISQAQERASALEGELATARQRLATTPQQVFSRRETTNGTPNDDARNLVSRLRQERAHMVEQYQPNYPGIKELDDKIALADEQAKANLQNSTFTDEKVRNPDFDALTAKVSSLIVEKSAVADQLLELQRQQAEAQSRIGTIRQASSQLEELLRTRDVLESVYKQIALQQAGASLQSVLAADQTASVRIVQPPSADATGKSTALLLIIAGLVLGLASAAAIAVVKTFGRQVYITPTDAEKSLKIPTLAELSPEESDEDSPAGLQKISRLASLLVDSDRASHPMSFIQISGTGEGEDKVALALLLGSEFGSNWRLPTLVIDLGGEAHAELHHKASGVQPVTIGGLELAIIKTQYPNLWAITQAPGMLSPLSNPRLSLDRVEQVIAVLRTKFKRLLMIAPRDFESYGARRLYALADAHLLVVRSEKSRAPVLRRLRDVILTSGGDILGMIYTHRRFYIPEVVYRWL
jgi:uncharacterized protein involved in exopolysaccharide biosynthesis